jgi:hypothetical protein
MASPESFDLIIRWTVVPQHPVLSREAAFNWYQLYRILFIVFFFCREFVVGLDCKEILAQREAGQVKLHVVGNRSGQPVRRNLRRARDWGLRKPDRMNEGVRVKPYGFPDLLSFLFDYHF